MADLMNQSSADETVTLQIHGMDCTCYADLLARKLNSLSGVKGQEIAPVTGQARITYDPAAVSVQEIIRTVSETGMTASLVRSEGRKSTWWREPQPLALYGCGLIALVAFIAGYFGASLTLVNGLYLLAVLVGVFYPARKALIALRNLTPTIHLLMLIGSVGAMLLGLWGEAAVLIFVYSLGDVLESYAVDKARGAIRSLMALVPKEALVRRNGREIICAVDSIGVGEVVRVRPGERIPVDGTVIAGISYVDQAAVTGEPIPVRRQAGDEVFAGTINQNGSLEVRVTKPASETMLSRIILSVEEAQAQRTSYQRFADSFGKWYTPAMFVLGVLVAIVPPLFFGAEWYPFIYRGLVVFVVSCSCGLALSVPVAVVGAMANAARHGTVFKGGTYLEVIDKVKVIAFDKTGTLTIGRPEVTDILAFNSARADEVLDLAGSLESRSSHPLAAAIVRKAREHGTLCNLPIEEFHEAAGLGVSARVDNQPCLVGSPRGLSEQGIDVSTAAETIARFEDEGRTVVLVGRDGYLIGLIAIADEMRPGAADAVQRLSRAGVRTVMLTGDNERSARAIAHRVGVDEYRAQLLPTDKVDVIRQLEEEHGTVAMVGDGINDAPAMAVANVGIAMGAAGTDIAIEAGDVVLMSADLGKIAFIRELSHRTVTTIRQNIAVSLINVAFMVVAALLGYLGLVTGLLLNEASAVFVILNALRLLTWRSSSERGTPGRGMPLPVITTPGEAGAPNPAAGCCCSSGVEPVAAGPSGYHSVATGCCGEPDGAVAPSSAVPEASSSGCGCTVPIIPVSGNISSCCCGENSQDRPSITGNCCSCETEEVPDQEAASTGCCSREPAAATKNPGLLAATYQIEGLGCACEGQIVEKRLKAKEGITFFSLNPITNQMKLIYNPSILSRQEIESEVKKAGATPVFVKSEAVSVSTGSTLSKKGYGE